LVHRVGIERKAQIRARGRELRGALSRKIACLDGELERGIVHQTRLERRAMR
jgi:hypothetical protein